MAEAFLNQMAGDKFYAESAGLEPGRLNPIVIEVMREINFDLSKNLTKSVFDFFKEGRIFHFVITVCDETNGEKCPIFPGVTKRLSWSFEDPASFTGTDDEKLAKTRLIRDKVKTEVENFIISYQNLSY